MEHNSQVIVQLTHFFEMLKQTGSELQKELVDLKIKSMREVSCESVFNLFEEEEIMLIKQTVVPKQKMCFKDAWNTADLLDSFGVKYCEGFLMFMGIPIEHAFNSINGKYFDVTRELAGQDDVTDSSYVVLKEYTAEEALLIMGAGSSHYFGGVFDKEFLLNKKLEV